jgi:hypothetical protein
MTIVLYIQIKERVQYLIPSDHLYFQDIIPAVVVKTGPLPVISEADLGVCIYFLILLRM